MMGDQATTVFTNQTQIDRLKNFKHMVEVEVNEVFGSPISQRFSWSWFVPIAVSFEGVLKEAILGYRLEGKDELETTPLMGSTTVGGAGSGNENTNTLANDTNGRKTKRKVIVLDLHQISCSYASLDLECYGRTCQ